MSSWAALVLLRQVLLKIWSGVPDTPTLFLTWVLGLVFSWLLKRTSRALRFLEIGPVAFLASSLLEVVEVAWLRLFFKFVCTEFGARRATFCQLLISFFAFFPVCSLSLLEGLLQLNFLHRRKPFFLRTLLWTSGGVICVSLLRSFDYPLFVFQSDLERSFFGFCMDSASLFRTFRISFAFDSFFLRTRLVPPDLRELVVY